MHEGRLVLAQLMQHLPLHAFRWAVAEFHGNRYVKRFTCLDQFLCMAFARLADARACAASRSACVPIKPSFYHLGIRGHIARSTLADANEQRDWRIYAGFAQRSAGDTGWLTRT
ncbi:DUF4372 domain-containing protein [Rhodanobacter sp. DHB23]|uniref:DUF4372 domain-containing protein n=1 Tax=Rhodanobacter sp. DHB23 TaxID=2775923 RepID=UPI00178161BE|nr:DUF4372 domain-containing protein [Rhodanobacter sp. DHB23]MBD8873527.1 DUF4372 domain-containing protein [Rhodanobacter sp. DHB23]